MNKHVLSVHAIVTLASLASVPTWAEDAPSGTPVAPTQDATAAPPAAPTLQPPMSASIVPNAKPFSMDAGPLGKIYLGAAVTGFAQFQDHRVPGDSAAQGDVTNAMGFINKADGMVQFFAQVGAYSLPTLGVPYTDASKTTDALFGPLAVGFIKIAPTDNFSVQAGKLPTLIGAEYTFSFQNLNIERGLLWNQEPAISRGVQVNYALGPVAVSASINDGLYSDSLSWISGLATWTINKENVLAVAGGGNYRKTNTSTSSTPILQNNEEIYNIIYTHTSGAWLIQPYFQYTYVPELPVLGPTRNASTYGVAVLVNYTFQASDSIFGVPLTGVSLPVRFEYISSSGYVKDHSPDLLGFGPGSNAYTFTITPTYQYNQFFARAEFAFIRAVDSTPGAALLFGKNGNDKQSRLMLEAGFVF